MTIEQERDFYRTAYLGALESFKAYSGDVPAELQIRDMNKRMDDMERDFDSRMNNANKLHEHQMEVQKSELVRKRDEAIDSADRELANQYQDNIDSLNKQPEAAPVQSRDDNLVQDWNNANPWVMQNGPKASYAKDLFGKYTQQGIPITDALANIDRDIAREFPAVNPNRENHPSPEKGSKPGNKRSSKKLGMSDLTSDEMKFYRAMPDAWSSEKDFLQTVQDTRSES